MHNFVPLYRLTNTMYNENENKKAYDKRREDVQRRTAAEGNRGVQSADDGLCDDGNAAGVLQAGELLTFPTSFHSARFCTLWSGWPLG